MPAIAKIEGPRGSGFWSSFDPKDYRLVAEALKEEFQRSEPIHDIHYAYSGPEHIPPHVRNGVLTEPGYAYFVKDEVGLELGGNTTIFVMEEGEMKGICARKLKEKHEKYLAEKESAERKQNRPWNALLAKFRRERPEEQALQCPTQ